MAGEWKSALAAVKDPAKRAELEKALSDVGELADELDKGYLRQSDYSRKQDELKREKETLQTNWNKASEEYTAMQQELQDVLADRDSTKAEKDDAAKKLKEAEDKLKAAPQVDTSKFLTNEDFEKKQREYAAGQTAYFGRTLKIIREHNKLFGNDLDPEEFIQDAMAAKKTPDEYWEEKYQVKAKRDELAKTAEEKKEKEWLKKGREEAISEMANPATRPLDSSKNPFYETSKEGKSLQPWDVEEAPDAEREFFKELQNARG
jgi:DNA repair exonuclease SbcCD ATPase subunit